MNRLFVLALVSRAALAQEAPAMDAPAPWEVKPEPPHARLDKDATTAVPNVISVNPLLWVNQEYAVEYERVLTRDVSIALEPTFNRFGINYFGSGTYWTRALGATLALRIYPYRRAPNGFYFAPAATVLFGHSTAAYVDGSSKRLDGYVAAFTANVGYTFIAFNHLALSLGLSGGITYGTITIDPTASLGWGYTFAPRASAGFAF